MIVSNTIFGPCPNNEWDHYVEFEEIQVSKDTFITRLKKNICKWLSNI